MIPTAETLTESLAACAETDKGITYLDRPDEHRRVPYAQMYANALGVLKNLQDKGLQPGDELIIFTRSNEQMIDGFWACVLGGFVPVPVAVGISDDHRAKLMRIFATLDNAWMYSQLELVQRLDDFCTAQSMTEEFGTLNARTINIEEIEDVSVAGEIHPARPEDPAMIQFSSGSTSAPKGVVLTHANLLTNVRDILKASGTTEADRSLSWMPLTHDMGLIGMHMTHLLGGLEQLQMETSLFSRRPLLWMEEASRFGATIICSPNFGYKHFLKLFESRGLSDEVNLAAVRLIYNGAEPISVPLIRRFNSALESYGLSSTAMYPVYGMAEACLAVSLPDPGREDPVLSVRRESLNIGEPVEAGQAGDADSLELICVGPVLDAISVQIADDSDAALPEGYVGHIHLKGANMTHGYYGGEAANQSTFTADGWLRTGDLGLVKDGELYITGRAKELIILNGQNYYPHDLERIAEETDGVELGKVVATGSHRPGEHEDELIIYLLHRGSLEDFLPLASRVRQRINEETALDARHVLPIPRVPKTTSGKVQRYALASQYRDGGFNDVIAEIEALRGPAAEDEGSASEIEQTVQNIIKEVLINREVGLDEDFFELGINSVALVEIHERIDETWPDVIEVTDLFETPSIRALAGFLEEKLAA